MTADMNATTPRHIALQFGRIKHLNEGLSEVSRQLALRLVGQAKLLAEQRNWHFHFILPQPWHGAFGGDAVSCHDLEEHMRRPHRFPVDLDVWHGLHQHMRYRPPDNSRFNIVTVHDLNHLYAKRGLRLWWQNLRMARHLRRAHRLVAISRYVASDMARHLPWALPAEVIHNGVADLSEAPRSPVEGLAGRSFLLHISRMSASKNTAALIEMATAWPEHELVLAGPPGPDVDGHRQRVQAMNLRNVRILTDVDEARKAWLYAHCEAFLFPSLMEGFGLPPIEAMFFGKPVVVARRTSLPEVCGDAAGYWDTFDPAGMRTVTEDWVAKHRADPSMADRARQQARQFTWEQSAQRYLDLYEKGLAPC